MWLRLGVALALLCLASGTLSKSNKKKKSETLKAASGPVEKTVFERQLVNERPKWKEVVENHAAFHHNTTHRNLHHATLAYVTPWNNHGYDVVKVLGGKFTLVSPVWLQVRREVGGGFVFGGEHDINQEWVEEVRRAGATAGVKIVPRLLFEGWRPIDFREVFQSGGERAQLAGDILRLIKKHKFDGLVVEIWSQVPSQALLQHIPGLVREISGVVRAAGFTFILVTPPPIYQSNVPGSFLRHHFEDLVEDVDAFSLMTYDFSSFQNPGPNSPLWWVKECVEKLVPDATSPNRAKILVGLNLYGLDHGVTGGTHVLGPQFLHILATYKPKFNYDATSHEHYVEYKTKQGRHVTFYPTLHSLSQRVALANQLGTGVSLWEVGQGLDYFYDLL